MPTKKKKELHGTNKKIRAYHLQKIDDRTRESNRRLESSKGKRERKRGCKIERKLVKRMEHSYVIIFFLA